MFGKRKTVEEVSWEIRKRNELAGEVGRWWHEIDRKLDDVLAQYQMTFLFPSGSPDDLATHSDLAKEQAHLRNMVGEYDAARANLIRFGKEHPEVNCPDWQDSHTAIRTMLRLKNRK